MNPAPQTNATFVGKRRIRNQFVNNPVTIFMIVPGSLLAALGIWMVMNDQFEASSERGIEAAFGVMFLVLGALGGGLGLLLRNIGQKYVCGVCGSGVSKTSPQCAAGGVVFGGPSQ